MWEVHLAAPEGIPRKGFFILKNDNLDQLLQKFWETEKLPYKSWTTEGILYERHFAKLAAENETGLYILKLPQREGQNLLREPYEEARPWFQQLEHFFQEHPNLHLVYSELMQEYEDLGHMNQNNKDASTTEERYYLPRQAVFRISKSTSHTLVLIWVAHVILVTESV